MIYEHSECRIENISLSYPAHGTKSGQRFQLEEGIQRKSMFLKGNAYIILNYLKKKII